MAAVRQQQPRVVPGLETDLGSAMGGSSRESKLPGGALHHLSGQQAGFLSSALFAAQALVAEQAASEELITPPANAEAPLTGLLLHPEAAAPAPAQCLFCGGLGSERACGPLRAATYDGQPVAVHHLCAIWSPGCYLPEGSTSYVNLEAEVRRAKTRSCTGCGQMGAAVPCSHPWCRAAYHLPCALGAPGVVLDSDTFELWCPAHTDIAEGAASDEDYTAAPAAPRPRRQPGSTSGAAKRPRVTNESQRPRTDWQKKDESTWLKVVPPWWCEQRTVHFATKVYKELFRSAGSAVLVDPAGGEWLCMVQTEARNDNRPQYTLRGAFADLWQAQGIAPGDTLIFKRDALTGHIELGLHAAGTAAAAGARMEEAAGSELSDPGSAHHHLEPSSGGRSRGGAGRQEASSELAGAGGMRGMSQQGSHPNRWMELADGWAIKTVYKSTLAHQQCPIAGWLFKKLYGRLPGESDRALMYDPDLDAEFRFDVSFISAANVHYITGKTFSGWVREAGLQAGEQIRMRREAGRVLIQRVPSERKVRVDFTTKANSRSASLAGMSDMAIAGAPAAHGQELASPPTAEALEALNSLVAAAGYADTHGTPAIHAALASAGLGVGAAAAAIAAAAGLNRGDVTAAAAAAHAAGMGGLVLPQSKRQRMGPADGGAAAELLFAQQEQAILAGRQGDAAAFSLLPSGQAGFSLAGWQPSAPHVLMFSQINQILAGHQWSQQEQAELLRFRAKYAWLDSCGREVAYMTVSQLQHDKAALLEFLRAAGQGILTQVAPGRGGVNGSADGTPAQGQLTAAQAMRLSPFAGAAAGTATATPVAATAAAVQPIQQEQQQQQQQQAHPAGRVLHQGDAGGATVGGMAPLPATSLEMHPTVDEAGGLAALLEGQSSFNGHMDIYSHPTFPLFAVSGSAEAVKQEGQEEHTTPNPAAALGPL